MTKRSRRHRGRSIAAAPLSCAAIIHQLKSMLRPVLAAIQYASAQEASEVCQSLLEAPLYILDIEANGARHASEIVEIGLVDGQGSVAFHSLVKPERASSPHAFAVHRISNEALEAAPSFEAIWPEVRGLLLSRTVISFDIRSDLAFLTQTLAKHRIAEPCLGELHLQCAMQLYRAYRASAQCIGLKQASAELGMQVQQRHRVVDDCQMTLELLRRMAQGQAVVPLLPLEAASGQS